MNFMFESQEHRTSEIFVFATRTQNSLISLSQSVMFFSLYRDSISVYFMRFQMIEFYKYEYFGKLIQFFVT